MPKQPRRAERSGPGVKPAEDFLRVGMIGKFVAQAVQEHGGREQRDSDRRVPANVVKHDALSLEHSGDGAGRLRHQRKTFEPIAAPRAAQKPMPTEYQVTTNATESVGQYIAYAIAPKPPESAPIAAPASARRVGAKARISQSSSAAAGAAR